jgi:hypothetical protein
MALIPCHECSGQVSGHAQMFMIKFLILALMFAAAGAMAQSFTPSIEELKIAADAGDPVAQDKLAARVDYKQSEVLYRKAAVQGYAHAQGKLGDMLYLRCQLAFGLKPADKAALADEAVKWVTLAANQGDKLGQVDLARMSLEGKLVKPDLIEAYKWGELSARNPSPDLVIYSGASTRDAAVLKMNADQMAEAHQRVAAFVPHQPKPSEVPEPGWVQKVKLGGINGTPDHRFAIINGKTFEKGDQTTVTIDGKKVTVSCLEIRASSVSISIEGIEGTRELKMSEH